MKVGFTVRGRILSFAIVSAFLLGVGAPSTSHAFGRGLKGSFGGGFGKKPGSSGGIKVPSSGKPSGGNGDNSSGDEESEPSRPFSETVAKQCTLSSGNGTLIDDDRGHYWRNNGSQITDGFFNVNCPISLPPDAKSVKIVMSGADTDPVNGLSCSIMVKVGDKSTVTIVSIQRNDGPGTGSKQVAIPSGATVSAYCSVPLSPSLDNPSYFERLEVY